MRAKWSLLIRKYWKKSEQLMVKYADLLICDSKNIERYIQATYKRYKPKTTFIAYGSDVKKSLLTDDAPQLTEWFRKFRISPMKYYLIVGRFVPENNYETMIREFMSSSTKKDLVIVTNVEHNKFFELLKTSTHFNLDERIKFVGTVYDTELLKKIREKAFAYIHGHSVGGTNPSLLEALASTGLNLLYDVGFNREVAEEGALYWNKSQGNLARLIVKADKKISDSEKKELAHLAISRIKDNYSWEKISAEYEKEWTMNNE